MATQLGQHNTTHEEKCIVLHALRTTPHLPIRRYTTQTRTLTTNYGNTTQHMKKCAVFYIHSGPGHNSNCRTKKDHADEKTTLIRSRSTALGRVDRAESGGLIAGRDVAMGRGVRGGFGTCSTLQTHLFAGGGRLPDGALFRV